MKQRALLHREQQIPYAIEHKRNVTRRIHLRAATDGSLLVIAPRRMSKRVIHQTLQKRVNHVARFLEGARERQLETPAHEFIDGERHLFLGRLLPLTLVETAARAGQVSFSENAITISGNDLNPERVKRLLIASYRTHCINYFTTRLQAIASEARWVEVEPSIRLRRMKRTWGSCSARGIITLNTRLIKTPPDCIDYVIAHELCHLKEMNHGKAFYALQAGLYPDWASARTHLRKKAHLYLVD